ncbi:exopolysaccharide biosynthesis protein [Opitutia bacterium ISCC 51]|nr:exopolysaccharide biosynthesis protein [Opitutae bacterium ISCC 51]QXD29644.1 exopolysaccharide biosynthesis protein [Opitutae bacterium ISCC 52]
MAHSNLSEDLKGLLLHGNDEGITMSNLVDALGDRGFGLLFIILSLPSALPIPAPGYSTPFGIMITILAIQMMAGRQSPWLPQWAAKKRIGRKMAERMIGTASKFFGKVEHLIKPRWGWVLAKSGHIFAGILIIVMACLMILPIPLTNTAPAMVIFVIGVAMTEDDGLGMLASCGLAICAVLLYVGVFWAISYYGLQGVDELKEIVKGWF